MSAVSLKALFACVLFGAAASMAVAGEAPWRLQEALAPADGFSVGLVHMSRFESITNNPLAGSSRDDGMIVQRTILDTRYRRGGVEAQLEFYDARQQLADDDAFVTNSAFNTLELLQATLTFDTPNEGSVRVGPARHRLGQPPLSRPQPSAQRHQHLRWIGMDSAAGKRGGRAPVRFPSDSPAAIGSDRLARQQTGHG